MCASRRGHREVAHLGHTSRSFTQVVRCSAEVAHTCTHQQEYVYQYEAFFHWAACRANHAGRHNDRLHHHHRARRHVFYMLIGLFFGGALISSLSATMVEIHT
eukprot:7748296-Heterocapsa_arctica.AAC.1